ncbi:phosphoribosylpyrophosphate synthetase [Dyadobacter sp. CY261]|uniref:phosphoribosylpyrophosphate synthetase n=1 Tax=Dyadobacter sp. CY261 TaxID=2907203 RepID=UPI001F3ED53C|nr:phosphoribosylpyrophosphate synthetase [Dyadobacter sp. CY261]MCF0069370.1 phosphoribosylpyrophosphate synthetase [Dyadobacter sp. CY261]
MENNSTHYSYDTLSEAVNELQRRGYTYNFLVPDTKDCVHCKEHSFELPANEFVIDEIYRFEGMTDPGDESIVFAISSTKNDIKGLVVNGFGADFGFRSSKLVEDLFKKTSV